MPPAQAVIKWRAAGGRLNPTAIGWPSGAMSTAGSRVTTDGSGAAVVTGSYAGATGLAHIVSDSLSLSVCATTKGLKKYSISTASSTIELSHGAPAGGACDNGGTAPSQYQSVVVFAFENRTWSSVGGVGFGGMPYLRGLAASCAYFTTWTETNPSQSSLTQYGGQVTGAFQPGMVNNCSPSSTCSTTANNIFRQARAAGKTAINYVEGATTGCSASGNVVRHVPGMYMWGADDRDFCTVQTRPYSEFDPNNPPNFAFITPNQCNNGHDCPNSSVDSWASTHVQRVLDSARYRAGQVAVFIWYDEDVPVPNLVLTPTARPGPFGTSGIGYASTLKAWESMLGFPCLANACTAPNMRTVAGV
jgi:acid phosphatase